MRLDFYNEKAVCGHPPECVWSRNICDWLLCSLGLHDWFPKPCVNVTLPWPFNMNKTYSAGWQFKWCRRDGCTVKRYSRWRP